MKRTRKAKKEEPRLSEQVMESTDRLIQISRLIDKLKNQTELNEVLRMLREREDWLQKETKLLFQVGDRVEFYGRGRMVTGTIIKILVKNIVIKEDNRNKWRVTPTLLRKVEI